MLSKAPVTDEGQAEQVTGRSLKRRRWEIRLSKNLATDQQKPPEQKIDTRKNGSIGFISTIYSNYSTSLPPPAPKVYFALYFWLHLGYPLQNSLLVALIPSGSMAFARIKDQDHTLQQTIGGVLWGTCHPAGRDRSDSFHMLSSFKTPCLFFVHSRRS